MDEYGDKKDKCDKHLTPVRKTSYKENKYVVSQTPISTFSLPSPCPLPPSRLLSSALYIYPPPSPTLIHLHFLPLPVLPTRV